MNQSNLTTKQKRLLDIEWIFAFIIVAAILIFCPKERELGLVAKYDPVPVTIVEKTKEVEDVNRNPYEIEICTLHKDILIEYDVPDIDTSFKTYTDYRKIADETSKQWNIKMSSYTDEDGMRRLISNDDYIIALGTYYTNNVGDRFLITLDTGKSFYATVGDIKQDNHTDKTNKYITSNGNVIEFHIDTDKVHKQVLLHGDISTYNKFSGSISKIEKVVN